MASGYIFRYDGISDARLIKALNHNKRELQKERGAKQHIDVAKTPLNYSLHDDKSPQEIYAMLTTYIQETYSTDLDLNDFPID